MLEIFSDMGDAALSVLGEGSLLRGSVECNVNIKNGVQMTGANDDDLIERDVASIHFKHNPKEGDTLVHPYPGGTSYILDRQIKDNGVMRQFIVMLA